jgi:hypothetical protein
MSAPASRTSHERTLDEGILPESSMSSVKLVRLLRLLLSFASATKLPFPRFLIMIPSLISSLNASLTVVRLRALALRYRVPTVISSPPFHTPCSIGPEDNRELR